MKTTALFRSEATGLLFPTQEEAGDISAILIDGNEFPVSTLTSTLEHTDPSGLTMTILTPNDAPPYTLATLRFGTDAQAFSAATLCGQVINGADALRTRLAAEYGMTADPSESFALAELRRDLAVTVERMRELQRSIAKNMKGE